MSTSTDPLHGQKGLHASVPAATTDTPRDPVTGTPATPAPHDGKPRNERAPDEIAHDIRRTRADISETLNEIEARISPHHLKAQVKGTVHETIDEVQERLNPRHLVHNARRTMIDTIRENPIPSILAGLSLGYLIFNPSSSERDRRVRGYDRMQGYTPYDYGRAGGYDRRYAPYDDYGRTVAQSYSDPRARMDGHGDSHSVGSRLDEARDRTREMAHQATERVSQFSGQAQEHMHEWREEAGEQMHRARSGVEAFVQDNPLAAGAIALGIGALLGGLLPPTPQEQAMMGSASERLTDRLGDAASSTISQARQAVQHVAEEAKEATRDESDSLRASAQHVADRVKGTARQEAENVRDTVREETGTRSEARTDGETSSQQTQPHRPSTTTAW